MKKFFFSFFQYLLLGFVILNLFYVFKTNMPYGVNLSWRQGEKIIITNLKNLNFYLQLLIWPAYLIYFLIQLVLGRIS